MERDKNILLIYNERSGTGNSLKAAYSTARYLADTNTPYEIKNVSEIRNRPAQFQGFTEVAVFGGDGTIFKAAKTIARVEGRKPILIPFPYGGQNILATEIGLGGLNKDTEVMEAVFKKVILPDKQNGHCLELFPVTYRLNRSKHEHLIFWHLTAGTGITYNTLRSLEESRLRNKLIQYAAIVKSGLNNSRYQDNVRVTVRKHDSPGIEEFDAVESTIIKNPPGRWSKVRVGAKPHSRVLLSIGRGETNRDPRSLALRVGMESFKAMMGYPIQEYDPGNQSRSLSVLDLNGFEQVIFTSSNQSFVVADSEITPTRAPWGTVTVTPETDNHSVRVFSLNNKY